MATNPNKAGGKKQLTARERAKKQRKRVVLFLIEVLVLAVMVLVLVLTNKATQMGKVQIDEEDLVFNEGVEDSTTMKGFRNIALFGVDNISGEVPQKDDGKARTDTIIIASINLDTKEVKLVSVYRDTYLNIGNGQYNKANSAYANGGFKQAITMLNANLDLNISDFVTVGFKGMIDAIDALGGVYIDVDSAELQHINNYQISITDGIGTNYTPVTETGYQLLDGTQATAYCRIRYTAGDDFKRASRQREVIAAMAEAAKSADISTLNKTVDEVIPNVYTSLDVDEILSLMKDLASYSIVDNTGFPFEGNITTGRIPDKGSCVIPIDLATNVTLLHEFLFDDAAYVVSDDIVEYSGQVESQTSPYLD